MMQRIAQNDGFNASSWATRIGLLVIGILSGGIAARTAVPVAADAISSSVPRFWAAVQSWIAPPYLLFAVHVIIFVIWKLSETKQNPGSHLAAAADGVEKTQAASEAKAKAVESYHAAPLVRKLSPEFWQEIQHTPEPRGSPPSEASCITMNSEENSISPVSSGFEIKKCVQPELDTSVVTLAKEAAPAATITVADAYPEEEAKVEDVEEGEENESMEATWKAIMEKSSRPVVAEGKPLPATSGRSPRPEAVAELQKPPMTIHDENKKFDDFIKKHHNQMRLQLHESDQRRVAVIANRSLISK